MDFLTEWITNIILFILLAIVIDLLLPNTGLQRYSKMVVGLLLIVIILTPVLEIFNKDVDQLLSSMKISTSVEENNMKNLIENKKKEIQASQRAYILEQMAVQMEKQVGEELENQYGYQVQHIELSIPEKKGEPSQEALTQVHVRLSDLENKGMDSIQPVQKVMIDTSAPIKEKSEDVDHIVPFLAKTWQIPEKVISIDLEGGEM